MAMRRTKIEMLEIDKIVLYRKAKHIRNAIPNPCSQFLSMLKSSYMLDHIWFDNAIWFHVSIIIFQLFRMHFDLLHR